MPRGNVSGFMGNSDGPSDEDWAFDDFRGVLANPDGLPPTELLRENIDSTPFCILHFLTKHSEQEFTSKEISERVDMQKSKVESSLAYLQERNLVRYDEARWAIGDDDRLAAFEGLLQSLSAIEKRNGSDEWDGWKDTATDPR